MVEKSEEAGEEDQEAGGHEELIDVHGCRKLYKSRNQSKRE